MAATLGALGIGLCVVFGGFIAVLLVEVYYILHCRHRRELQANSMASGERGLIFNLNQAASQLLDLAYWRRRLKYGVSYLISQQHDHHSSSNQQRSIPALQTDASFTELQASPVYCPPIHSEFVARLFPLQGDLSEDGDILHLLGPPRLLFTIKEETREDLESEDSKSKTGRSRGASTPSSEFLPQLDSDSVTPLDTPFVTPPSTPPASPPMSPPSLPLQQEQRGGGEAEEAVPSHLFKPLNIFIDESSSSFSSSSSENITPPIPSSPPRNPLSTLMEETSSSSSSSTATPFDLSPPVPAHTPNRGRGSRGSFLDIPSQNRVYPLEAPSFKAAPAPIRERHSPRGNFVIRNHFEGVPCLAVSAADGFCSSVEISEPMQAAFLSRQFQHPSDFSSSPSPPWPPSPPTPPLHSALSSPVFTSPSLNPVDSSIAFNGA